MTWLPVLIIAALLVGLYALKRMSFVSAEKARQFLREGALVVDVRSPGEFNAGHVPGAMNLPLGSLANEAPSRIADKDKILLLHCLSGTRSGIARAQLRRLGYTSVFNLGSYGRAEEIVCAAQQTSGRSTATGGSPR